MNFHLRKTNGRRHYYYLELWGLVASSEKVLIGHEESGKFSRGSFLLLPPHEVYQGFLIASKSEAKRTEIKKLIETDTEFHETMKRLTYKEFCHMTVGPEIHVGGPFLLKRVTVLRYLALPDENVGPWERDLNLVASKLGLNPP